MVCEKGLPNCNFFYCYVINMRYVVTENGVKTILFVVRKEIEFLFSTQQKL